MLIVHPHTVSVKSIFFEKSNKKIHQSQIRVLVDFVNMMPTDCSVLRTPTILKNIRNSLIFLQKWLLSHVFAVPIDTNTYASIRFVSICPLNHQYFNIDPDKKQEMKNCRFLLTNAGFCPKLMNETELTARHRGKTKKRDSTFRTIYREGITGARFLCGRDGTCLGVLHESAA